MGGRPTPAAVVSLVNDVLVISGSMGSGKTTVLGEASDLLTQAGIIHAALDVDVLGVGLWPDAAVDNLLFRNLSSVCANYRSAGIARLLLAEAADSAATLARVREATAATSLVVCRLRATLATMQQRVRLREPGMLQQQFVARVVELEAALDAAGADDFSLDNDDRSVTEVAREMLQRAGWLSPGDAGY
jgi:hypothetical protein